MPPDSAAAVPDLTARLRELAAEAGISRPNLHGNGVAITLQQIGLTLPAGHNRAIKVIDDPAPPGVTLHPVTYPAQRTLPRWVCHETLPYWLTENGHIGHEPGLTVAGLPGGVVFQFGNGPVVLTADGRTALSAYSNRYARLLHFQPVDVAAAVRAARSIDGPAFLLSDDIAPANYSHWLLDALPRLAALQFAGYGREVTLVVRRLEHDYQREALRLCGWDLARVIELAPMQALRAGELLVTNDQPEPPHPMFKGAPWARRFLTRHLAGAAPAPAPGRRLYLSRADAAVRHVVNEPELEAMLAKRGFETVTLAGKSVRAQAELFAAAAWIVAPHGAGLTNLLFTPRGATVLELFSPTYGTPAYYVIAASGGLRYACHVVPETDVVRHPTENPQFDDFHVRPDVLAERYAAFLPLP